MSTILAGLLVFFSSAAVLALEILAARLLAPYVGVTLETYTGVIATVLAGISIGAWIGGRLADRWHPRHLIGPAVALGGVLTLLTAPIVRTAGPSVHGSRVTATVLLALLGFFAPALVLSTVPTMVIKLRLHDLDETGRVAGRLSAISTAGAIVGTLVTGYVFIAAWPIGLTLAILGAALIASGLLVWVWLGRGARAATAVVVLIGIAIGAWATRTSSACDRETKYYCARLENAGDSGRFLFLDNLLHSYVNLEDPLDLRFYIRTFADVLDVVRGAEAPINALHVGGGGFSFPRYIAASRPGSRNHVLEVDPGVAALAREELGLQTDSRLTVAVGDARLGIRAVRRSSFDIVVGDAFGGLAVPWHLTTAEFVADVRRALSPSGVYLVNLIDFPPLAFVRAQVATFQAVFDHVALIATDQFAGESGGNFVAIASDAPIDVAAIDSRIRRTGRNEPMYSGDALTKLVDGARVLRDDHAPVDQLLTVP